MPVWRMQVSMGADLPDQRERFVITPHFNDQGVGSDPQALATDLAVAIAAKTLTESPAREVNVKAYDAEGTQPVFPAGQHTVNLGAFPASTTMREVAICLSFYAGQNRPRYRGRLYIPATVMAISAGLRPSALHRDKIGSWATIFADLGGPDVDWCVYSRVDGVARSVSHWWVDDEFDVQRSRGLRTSARTVGVVNE